jgi:hypothetical protein
MDKIYSFFGNIFKSQEQIWEENRKIKDDEQIKKDKWINEKLIEWKLDMYSNNTYLQFIPANRILEKKKELEKEYQLNIL